ncbi:MAG: NYN domain-containing protein [Hydrogenobacter sp.]|uniref:LabA-like NYN domain-containing protein n=1 Tax=Hydrogenobacter thermophilus TaxID=940 RepID=UPI0030FCB194
MRKRAGIFIDGANFYFVQKHILHQKIDLIKLVDYFKKDYTIYNTFFYLAYREGDEKQENFIKLLAFSGITVVKKPIKQLKDGTYKGSLDVDMALDVLLTKDNYDIAVLCSGDSDFEKLVWVLRDFGKEVICVSTKESSAVELVNACDRYIDLADIMPYIRLEEKE